MEHGFLYEALPFLNGLDKEEQEQFAEYFKTAPLWLIDSFRVEKVKKGTAFTREGEPADTVFFIAGGTIAATDYRMECLMITGDLTEYMLSGLWRF